MNRTMVDHDTCSDVTLLFKLIFIYSQVHIADQEYDRHLTSYKQMVNCYFFFFFFLSTINGRRRLEQYCMQVYIIVSNNCSTMHGIHANLLTSLLVSCETVLICCLREQQTIKIECMQLIN